ncbi:hypothetical protein LuPra_01944 [Luteitalea pratensis]|uniref:Uncharacterized protein n=1 Tax=Luteitalea pratensis TaxID=1855912 RepID=A0A143PKG2_LUTPR|nr:hypothetical protein [Luteitalea pratensis]AMY08740.1 hypothetical protein LuPra_01944 [Luteitalea pratensis]
MLSRRDVLHALTAGAAWPAFGSADSNAQTGDPPLVAGTARTFAGVACRWCPPGTFLMVSPGDEPRRRDDEAQVSVRFTRGFWMAAHETT